MHLGERKEAFASAPSYQGLPQVPAVYPPLPHHWAVHLWVWGGVPNGRFRGALGQATWYVAQTCSKALVVKFQVKMVPTTTGKEAGLRTAGSLRAATLRTMTQPFPLFPRINPKSSPLPITVSSLWLEHPWTMPHLRILALTHYLSPTWNATLSARPCPTRSCIKSPKESTQILF